MNVWTFPTRQGEPQPKQTHFFDKRYACDLWTVFIEISFSLAYTNTWEPMQKNMRIELIRWSSSEIVALRICSVVCVYIYISWPTRSHMLVFVHVRVVGMVLGLCAIPLPACSHMLVFVHVLYWCWHVVCVCVTLLVEWKCVCVCVSLCSACVRTGTGTLLSPPSHPCPRLSWLCSGCNAPGCNASDDRPSRCRACVRTGTWTLLSPPPTPAQD